MEAHTRALEEYNNQMDDWYKQNSSYLKGTGATFSKYRIDPNMSYRDRVMLSGRMARDHKALAASGGEFDYVKGQRAAEKKKGMSWWKKALIIGGAIGGAMFIPGAQALVGKALGFLGKGAGKFGKLMGIKGKGAGNLAKLSKFGHKVPASAAKLGTSSTLPTGATYGMHLPGITGGVAKFGAGQAMPHLGQLARPGLLSKALTGHATQFKGPGFFSRLGGGIKDAIMGKQGFGGFSRGPQGGWANWKNIGHGYNMYQKGSQYAGRAHGLLNRALGGQQQAGATPTGGGAGQPLTGPGADQKWNPAAAMNLYAGSRLPSPAQSVSMFRDSILSPRRSMDQGLSMFGARGHGAWSRVGTPGGYGQPWRGFLGGRTFEPWV